MLVPLHRKAFEATLPNVSADPIIFVVAANVACHDQVHPGGKRRALFRGYDEVKMVGHQTIGIKLDGKTFCRACHQIHECIVILILMEYLLFVISPVDDVIDKAVR